MGASVKRGREASKLVQEHSVPIDKDRVLPVGLVRSMTAPAETESIFIRNHSSAVRQNDCCETERLVQEVMDKLTCQMTEAKEADVVNQ